MDLYEYKAMDANFSTITGEMNADSEQEVLKYIRDRGMSPISINQAGARNKMKNLASADIAPKKVQMVDLSVFCRQLSTMIRAGMPLDRAMGVQINQTENPTLKKALQQVEVELRQGVPLSRAMQEDTDVFPKLLINMIETGEATGNIDAALERMSEHYDKENRINRRIKGAMIYPMVLFILTMVVAIGLIVFVIPTFSEMFEEADSSLPGLTQFLVNVSDSMKGYWYIYIAVGFGIVFGIKSWIGSERGRYTFDGWKLKLPIIKKPMQQIVTARFTRTLSTMLSSGITIVQAMESSAETANNVVVEEKVLTATEDLKRGEPLARQLEQAEVFPDMMISMIGIGEETGDLDNMLAKTADYYDEEFDTAISKMLSLIEPLMIIFMAAVVGLIVIAMYLPMFGIYDVIA